jgi:penicillin-binding protein 1B
MNEKVISFFNKLKAWLKKENLFKIFRITTDVAWNVILIFIIVFLIGGFFVGGIGAGYFASLVKDEPIRPKEEMRQAIYNYEETTELYFADNVYLGKLSADLHREEVDIKDVSQYVKDALIATEDEYFNEHKGVVPKAIFRALFQEFTNSDTKTGGSTLTQQLIKNQILTNEVSFERKAKEILLALRLEEFFEKDEILEAYLNVVEFGRDSAGRNIAGIQTAAQGVFGIDASELNLPQAAFLAGLPQSPYAYTPFKNGGELKSEEGREPGLKRMKYVLKRMLETEKITQEQYEEAINYDIEADFIEPQPLPNQEYPFLTVEIEKRAEDIIAEQLATQDGYTKEDLENNDELEEQYSILAERAIRQKGYRIHTTIDKEVYDEFQRIAKEYDEYKPTHTIVKVDPETGEKSTVENIVQPGAILIENKTGKIIAFVAGRDFNISENNHATYTKRPNGSTMKPILDYAPAMELGIIQPGTPFPDVKNKGANEGANWLPNNYTSREYGITSARNALAQSYNITATRIYKEILDQRPANYLKQMGFTSLIEDDMTNASMAIGSLSIGVTVEENTNAFVTFGNMGKFVDAYMIERIETKDGEVIYEHESEMVDIFSPQTAYLTIDMMRDVISRGTATYLNSALAPEFRHVDWAGKTGSTENIQDTWFVATNPNVTMGSWMGYDIYDADGDGDGFDGEANDPDNRIHLNYSGVSNLGYSARNIKFWAELVNAASKLRPDLMVPDKPFENPGGIVTKSICAVSGLLPSEACEKAGLVVTDIFNAKYVPKEKDYSLLEGNYVIIDGKKYVAKEGTPEEFMEEGFILNPEFLKDRGWDKVHDLQALIPSGDNWSKILIPETEELKDDGKAPNAPTNVQLSGSILKWKASSSKDVIGYYIYAVNESGGKGTKIGATKETNFKLPNTNQSYYVTAVDYFGQESAVSDEAIFGQIPSGSTSISGLKANVNGNAITLSWSKPTSKDFSHITIFRGNQKIAENIKGTSYTDKGVQPGNTYRYRVVAFDKDGKVMDQTSIEVTVQAGGQNNPEEDHTPPGLVTITNVEIDENKIKISFVPPNDPDLAGINIYQGSLLLQTVEPKSKTITISGLPNYDNLFLSAVDKSGNESKKVPVK